MAIGTRAPSRASGADQAFPETLAAHRGKSIPICLTTTTHTYPNPFPPQA